MIFLERCRNAAFWTMDAIRGGEVRKDYNELKKYCDSVVSQKEIEEYHKKAIDILLRRTMDNVPYYSSIREPILSTWPVITKATIKENSETFLSKEYKNQHLFRMSTSGSTGTPFVTLQNASKKRRVNAETIFYLGLQGYKVGQRIIFLRSVVDECRKSDYEQFKQNIYQVNCNDLSDNGISNQLEIIEKLSKNCGAILIAYASTYEAFHQYFERHTYEKAKKCNILSMTSGSEMLYDATRLSMEKAFECKCYSRYANEENGFLGQDGLYNNLFLINEADYYIEILRFDSDYPVKQGEKGRIVVTDLYNYAQPMIRYDTGDIGAIMEIDDGNIIRRAIGDFSGRVVDSVYRTDGKLISPHAITNAMWKYQSIKQFQFIQRAKKEYLIIINSGDKPVDEGELIKDLEEIVGQDASFRVQYCDDIPVLSSGKRRYIVNEMQNKEQVN